MGDFFFQGFAASGFEPEGPVSVVFDSVLAFLCSPCFAFFASFVLTADHQGKSGGSPVVLPIPAGPAKQISGLASISSSE